jgi:hypothetical protein
MPSQRSANDPPPGRQTNPGKGKRVDISKWLFQLASNILYAAGLKPTFAIGFWGIHWFIEIGGPSRDSKVKDTVEQHVFART